jgi:hypothetical protein
LLTGKADTAQAGKESDGVGFRKGDSGISLDLSFPFLNMTRMQA